MSLRRLAATCGVEFRHSLGRPLFIALALLLLLSAFGLSSGKMSISSGDSSVGGTKAWITSEFAQTQMMTFIVLLYYAFFIAITGGFIVLMVWQMAVTALFNHAIPNAPALEIRGPFRVMSYLVPVLTI